MPRLLDGELDGIAPKTDVPILLPQRMPDEFEEYFPTGFGRERGWGLQLGAATGCGGATACFIASFKGREGGRPFGSRRVQAKVGTEATEVRVFKRMANSAIRNGPR